MREWRRRWLRTDGPRPSAWGEQVQLRSEQDGVEQSFAYPLREEREYRMPRADSLQRLVGS